MTAGGSIKQAAAGSKGAATHIKVEPRQQQQHSAGALSIQLPAAPATAETALRSAFSPASAAAAADVVGPAAGPSSTADPPGGAATPAALGAPAAQEATADQELTSAVAGPLGLQELRILLEGVCADRQDAKEHMVPIRY